MVHGTIMIVFSWPVPNDGSIIYIRHRVTRKKMINDYIHEFFFVVSSQAITIRKSLMITNGKIILSNQQSDIAGNCIRCARQTQDSLFVEALPFPTKYYERNPNHIIIFTNINIWMKSKVPDFLLLLIRYVYMISLQLI